MRYYVQGADGKTYGPVDIPELEQWVRDRRVVRETMLRDADSGAQVQAQSIPQLHLLFAEMIPDAQPPYVQVNACLRCGAPGAYGARVCPSCGSPAPGYSPGG